MDEFQKVMVALSFAEHSQDKFRYAARLAKKMNAALIACSVINSRDVEAVRRIVSMGYDVDGEHYVESIRKERRQLLDQYIAISGFPTEKIQVIFRVGNPADELLKIAVEESVGLIVMGIKGRSELERLLVGSVAEKLFRRSPIPIVSYRDPKSAERLLKRLRAG